MNEEDDAYKHTGEILNEIRESEDISDGEKEIAYSLGTNIFRIGREMEAYEMSDLKEYLVQAFDVIYDLLKRGDKKNIPAMKEIAKYSEEMFGHIDKIEELIEKISKNAQKLEDNLERKVAVEEIISAMKSKR